jgi:hydrocephalus-inducing protein
MTVTLTFVPKGALHYSCTAYCNISCSEERLALNLDGEGEGPKALLSQNDLQLGDRFVNEEYVQDIMIENKGEIECKYELLPNDRNFGKMFNFD